MKTQWIRIAHLWYKCVGCSLQCQAVGYRHEFVQGETCDGTDDGFQAICKRMQEREDVSREIPPIGGA